MHLRSRGQEQWVLLPKSEEINDGPLFQPSCDSSGNPQCAYLDIGVVTDNWKVGDCYMRDAFACQG